MPLARECVAVAKEGARGAAPLSPHPSTQLREFVMDYLVGQANFTISLLTPPASHCFAMNLTDWGVIKPADRGGGDMKPAGM
jgi:hypothetical protein